MKLRLSLFLLLSSVGCLCAKSELRTQTQLVVDGKLLQNIDAVAATNDGRIMVSCESGFLTFGGDELNEDFLESWGIDIKKVNEDYAKLLKKKELQTAEFELKKQALQDELLLILKGVEPFLEVTKSLTECSVDLEPGARTVFFPYIENKNTSETMSSMVKYVFLYKEHASAPLRLKISDNAYDKVNLKRLSLSGKNLSIGDTYHTVRKSEQRGQAYAEVGRTSDGKSVRGLKHTLNTSYYLEPNGELGVNDVSYVMIFERSGLISDSYIVRGEKRILLGVKRMLGLKQTWDTTRGRSVLIISSNFSCKLVRL